MMMSFLERKLFFGARAFAAFGFRRFGLFALRLLRLCHRFPARRAARMLMRGRARPLAGKLGSEWLTITCLAREKIAG